MAGLSKKYLALIALPLLLAACQTADQQKKRQQQQEAIGAINEFSAQKPARRREFLSRRLGGSEQELCSSAPINRQSRF